MKQLLLIILYLALSPLPLIAQIPDTSWAKVYGGVLNDGGNSIQQTLDGGYIIAGYTGSFGNGNNDIWLIKTDAYGDSLWTKTYGGYFSDEAYSVQQTIDGGYIIVGATEPYGAGGKDVWLLKTDSLGNVVWNNTYGGPYWDQGFSVKQTSDSGYVVTGTVSISGKVKTDVWLLKADASGNTEWSKSYGEIWHYRTGMSVCETIDSGYVIAGSDYPDGAWSPSLLIIKTDANGDTIWTRTFYDGGGGSGQYVQQTSENDYIVVGLAGYGGGGPGPFVYLIRIDAWGDTLWTRVFGDTLTWSYVWRGYSVQQTADGGFIIVGEHCFRDSDSDILVIRTDANGDTLCTRTYGERGSEIGSSISKTNDNGYVIVGKTSSFGSGGDDVYIIKLAADTLPLEEKRSTTSVVPCLRAYPNPFCDIVSITFTEHNINDNIELKIYDATGRLIKDFAVSASCFQQPGVSWNGCDNRGMCVPEGVYFLKAVTLRGNSFLKLVKLQE